MTQDYLINSKSTPFLVFPRCKNKTDIILVCRIIQLGQSEEEKVE